MKWKFAVRPLNCANKSAPVCVGKINLGDWRWTLIRTQIIVLAESISCWGSLRKEKRLPPKASLVSSLQKLLLQTCVINQTALPDRCKMLWLLQKWLIKICLFQLCWFCDVVVILDVLPSPRLTIVPSSPAQSSFASWWASHRIHPRTDPPPECVCCRSAAKGKVTNLLTM